eukprot:6361332-Prymnesium_polylepis.1
MTSALPTTTCSSAAPLAAATFWRLAEGCASLAFEETSPRCVEMRAATVRPAPLAARASTCLSRRSSCGRSVQWWSGTAAACSNVRSFVLSRRATASGSTTRGPSTSISSLALSSSSSSVSITSSTNCRSSSSPWSSSTSSSLSSEAPSDCAPRRAVPC